MSVITRTLSALRAARRKPAAHHALIGFDGFVDTVVSAVDRRFGPEENYSAIPTIDAFAERISNAAGKSTNIELYPRMEKSGGNAPLMAKAMAASGVNVTLVGALGVPEIHPVFRDFSENCRLVSLCEPAHTTALEFQDGKVMLGTHHSLAAIDLPAIERAMGEDGFLRHLATCDLIALLNWTMLPHMTAILSGLADEILPSLPAAKTRHFFFDLCDPEKRSSGELLAVLKTIARFSAHGEVTLGLNLKEAQRIHRELAFPPAGEENDGLLQMARDIRGDLNLAMVIVHTRRKAAGAWSGNSSVVDGPYTPTPRVSTGAGDHFNGGYARGLLLGLGPEECLALGCATSGHYVRTAQTPTLDDLEEFLAKWKSHKLD